MLWMNSQTSAPAPMAVSLQPIQSSYSLHAWSGSTYSVGEALNNAAPVKRRAFPGETPEPGTVPLGDAPWVWLLLCAVAYGVSRRWRVG